jgi:hypothetical protein
MPKINISQLQLNKEDPELIDGPEGLNDRGPWRVNEWDAERDKRGALPRVVLQSDDFNHDVALIVTGDFYSLEQKKRYAYLLADRMNRMPPE